MKAGGVMRVIEEHAGWNGAGQRAFPGRLMFYHPNGQGSGSAFRLELKLNRPREDRYGCYFIEMAKQKSIADRARGGSAAFATFDWENKATIKLGFLDVCAILRVLEERADRLGPEGKGLYHQNGTTNTLITLQRSAKTSGYYLGISRKESTAAEPLKAGILLTEAESIGLRCVLQSGLFYLAFCESEALTSEPAVVQQ